MASNSVKSTFAWNKDNLPKQPFINNEFVDSKSTKTLSVTNPKDGSLVSSDVPVSGAEDVEAAVSAAEAAFPAWKKMSPTVRRGLLLKLADLIEANVTALAELGRLTMGAPVSIGAMEAGMAVEFFRYYAGWTDKFAGETFPQDDGFLKIVRNEPLGVTAAIIPWNGPMVNIALKAPAALASGNCIIVKPSEKAPFPALALGSLIKEAGFPQGVFQVLPGDGTTGALLAGHMRIRKVSFTGSTGTGKKIQEMAAKSNLKRVTLELGGKSPAAVFDDCNVDNAVFWCANGITMNSGQVCYAASRVYVQEGIYDEFVKKYKAAIEERAKAVGDPDAAETMVGPVADKLQYDRVAGFIDRGKSQGTLLSGGQKISEKGFYIQPTIFENVPEDAEITKQEIFGPVSVLNKFKTEEEIIAKANDTEYGLMAGVFTQDINKALRVAAEIDSGMVGINCVSISFPQAPFGGSKQSGIGRENGRNALMAWTDTKTVMVNLTY